MDNSQDCSNGDNSSVNKLVNKCLAAKPTMRNTVNSKYGRPSYTPLKGDKFLKDDFLRLPNNSHNMDSAEDKETDNNCDMKKIMRDVTTEIKQDLGNVNFKLDRLANVMDNLIERVDVIEQNESELKQKCDEYESRIAELEFYMDDCKRKERLNKLLFHGNIINATSTTLKADVHKLFVDKLKLPADLIKEVGVFKFGTGSHSVLLDLPIHDSPNIKKELFLAMRGFSQGENAENVDSANLYLNEFLTPRNAELLKCCRDLKKVKRIHSAFSFQGQVYIKISDSADKKRIKTKSDIPN